MSFTRGEVIANYTHVWRDTGSHEAKCARDCLIAIADKDEEIYYLTMSTHNDTAWEFYQKYPEWNYLLTKKKCESLKKTSVVNLKLINKAKPMGKYLFAVSDQVFTDLIRRFKEWQNENPDPLYEEIKDIV